MRITRELNKESLMYSYTIYTKELWSVLAINSLTLKYTCCPWIYHTVTTRQTCLWCHCSGSFYYVPDLWHYIMWHIMWPWSYASLSSKRKNQNKLLGTPWQDPICQKMNIQLNVCAPSLCRLIFHFNFPFSFS